MADQRDKLDQKKIKVDILFFVYCYHLHCFDQLGYYQFYFKACFYIFSRSSFKSKTQRAKVEHKFVKQTIHSANIGYSHNRIEEELALCNTMYVICMAHTYLSWSMIFKIEFPKISRTILWSDKVMRNDCTISCTKDWLLTETLKSKCMHAHMNHTRCIWDT